MTNLLKHDAALYSENSVARNARFACVAHAFSPASFAQEDDMATSPRPAVEAILNSKQACEYLRISPASLSRAVNGKLGNATKLRVIRYGRVHRFRLEALDQWLLENES